METRKSSDRSDGEVAGAIIAGAIVCLAGYGLYKLFSDEYERGLAISQRKESDLLQQFLQREIGN